MKDNVEMESEDVENIADILKGYISWNIWFTIINFSRYQEKAFVNIFFTNFNVMFVS